MIPYRYGLRPFGALLLTAGVLFTATRALAAASGQSGVTRSGHSVNQPGYLGVDIRDVTDDQAAAAKAQGQQRGAEIVGMDHDGPACKAGIQIHDVIQQMNGQAIDGEDQLRHMLRDTQSGKQVTFLVSRDGQQRTVVLQMADREEVGRKAWENHYTVPAPEGSSSAFSSLHANGFLHGSPSSASNALRREAHSLLGSSVIVNSAYTGAKLEVMGPQLAEFFGTSGSAGLLVREVEAGSPASEAGLRAGDVVVRVNEQQVVNGSDWTKIIHDNRGRQVDVIVLREKHEKTITMTPDSKKRSSLEHNMGIEEYFGDSEGARQTRAVLAELAPTFTAMTASLHQRMDEIQTSPEILRMRRRLELFSTNPAFHRQIDEATQQVLAAATSVRSVVYSPQLAELRQQTRDLMRLD